ncbi:MAG: hypothetical protein DMF95_19115 [Acidobacteria bacterium]|nr:MAG: hypothetical protein DMF95_19115 [Acidobacteriota bacterium]
MGRPLSPRPKSARVPAARARVPGALRGSPHCRAVAGNLRDVNGSRQLFQAPLSRLRARARDFHSLSGRRPADLRSRFVRRRLSRLAHVHNHGADGHGVPGGCRPRTPERLRGFVALPSLHTLVAVFILGVVRRTPLLFWFLLPITSLLVGSTFLLGYHYLLDVAIAVPLGCLFVPSNR